MKYFHRNCWKKSLICRTHAMNISVIANVMLKNHPPEKPVKLAPLTVKKIYGILKKKKSLFSNGKWSS